MCGVVAITYKEDNKNIGYEAAALLKRLEYRGYDSTGASFVNDKKEVMLVKKTGSPTKVVKELEIERFSGQRFIGQVRWATYGAVTDINSQPHLVNCFSRLLGAHNGNISNTDILKKELMQSMHNVISDNDGEILVHLIEDQYALNKQNPSLIIQEMEKKWNEINLGKEPDNEVFLLIDAARKAENRAEGSYAACVTDPAINGTIALKSGSSLYAGVGNDGAGSFIVVSSDLTSVLSKTHFLIPISEGEGLWFDNERWFLFSLSGDPRFSKPLLKRSRLNVQDTALDPHWSFYMEQEIYCSTYNIKEILRYYFSDPDTETIEKIFEQKRHETKEIMDEVQRIADISDFETVKKEFAKFVSGDQYAEFKSILPKVNYQKENFISDESQFFKDILSCFSEKKSDLCILDSIVVWEKRSTIRNYLNKLVEKIRTSFSKGGRIYLVASGTSYNAALTGAVFFDHLSGIPVYPCTPGFFKNTYFDCLDAKDIIIGISQSGETKDLVDIFVDISINKKNICRVSIVNNENSRIPQELSDFYLPILCGPEVAVAATKSFINQLVIFYILAASFKMSNNEIVKKMEKAALLIEDMFKISTTSIDKAAEMLFMKPSMHILATSLVGLAREGALKVREVVLNHTEGYDTAEFKHGPNTILGKNTIFGLNELTMFINKYNEILQSECSTKGNISLKGAIEIIKSNPELIEKIFANYPLVFICPPVTSDIRLTISQIHTHKIRGADIIVFAEENTGLKMASENNPQSLSEYHSIYIKLPKSEDPHLFVFSAAVALQYFAFRMSVLKKSELDTIGIENHGVHPDAPKNVSKAITVD